MKPSAAAPELLQQLPLPSGVPTAFKPMSSLSLLTAALHDSIQAVLVSLKGCMVYQ